MNLDELLAEFEAVPRYTAGKHEYIAKPFFEYPAGTRVFDVYTWFSDEYKKELLGGLS